MSKHLPEQEIWTSFWWWLGGPYCFMTISMSSMISLKRALGMQARWISNVGASRRHRLGSRPTNGAIWSCLTLEKETSRPLAREHLLEDAMQQFKSHTDKSSLQNTQVKLIAIDKINEGEFRCALRQDSFIEGCLKLSRGQMFDLSLPSLLCSYFHEGVAKKNEDYLVWNSCGLKVPLTAYGRLRSPTFGVQSSKSSQSPVIDLANNHTGLLYLPP
jgi:hypothetical protein